MSGVQERASAAVGRVAPKPFSVLFLCTHNSARSQIAEAVLRHRGGNLYEAASAGSEPAGAVHPLAERVIREIGGDPALHRPKGFEDVLGRDWDLVITVCDQAAEACPTLPTRTVSAHWGIADPSKVQGSEEQRMAAFMEAYGALAKRIELLIALGPEKLDRTALRERLARIHHQAGGPAGG
jgi:arsenate reductase (thioredoxin)